MTHRLLILALAPFGDAAPLTEPLAARRGARPGEHVTVAAHPGLCDLLRGWRLADASWEIVSTSPSPAQGAFRTAALLARAGRSRFDEVVDLFPHLRSAIASRLASRRGIARGDAAFVDAIFRLRAKVQGSYDPVERMARALGVEEVDTNVAFSIDREADAWVERALGATGYRGGEPVVTLHSEGHWPGANFVEIVGKLRSNFGARVIVADTPRRGKRARALAGALGGSVLGLASPTASRYLAALARASVVVTDDPGTAYFAGLVRAPALLVAASGRPLPTFRAGSIALTAADVAGVSAATAYDAACKLVRKERTGQLFG